MLSIRVMSSEPLRIRMAAIAIPEKIKVENAVGGSTILLSKACMVFIVSQKVLSIRIGFFAVMPVIASVRFAIVLGFSRISFTSSDRSIFHPFHLVIAISFVEMDVLYKKSSS